MNMNTLPKSERSEADAFSPLIVVSAVDPDCVVQVNVPGREPLAVYNLDGEYFVTADTCTHGEASLSDGELLSDGTIECPFHGGSFDVRSGRPCKYPCSIAIATYEVEIRDGWVFAALD
jgi:nitrite reductase/ring-hydroxylating ferredoxin subunit|tara:strand:- start:1134 stop:1490 length:357 start_codon:yes stop_codon:yes gene_type:complete